MQAVVFDFDGVIVDSEILHDEALRAVCVPLGIEWAGHPWVGWPDADVLHEVFRRRGEPLDDARLATLLDRKTEAVLRQVQEGKYHPYPGSLELIRSAAESARVAVCSAGLRGQIVPVLERLGVMSLVSAMVAFEDTTRSKPDPQPYALAAARLGARPEECVAIEDSARGVASARAAGLVVVAVGHTSPREDLAAAHHFARSTSDLSVDFLRSLVKERRAATSPSR